MLLFQLTCCNEGGIHCANLIFRSQKLPENFVYNMFLNKLWIIEWALPNELGEEESHSTAVGVQAQIMCGGRQNQKISLEIFYFSPSWHQKVNSHELYADQTASNFVLN